MISRKLLVKAIRKLGYKYKGETKSQHVYKQKGGTNLVFIPKRKLVSEQYAQKALKRAGATSQEIEEWLHAVSDEELAAK